MGLKLEVYGEGKKGLKSGRRNKPDIKFSGGTKRERKER